jgi:hypothetical protein
MQDRRAIRRLGARTPRCWTGRPASTPRRHQSARTGIRSSVQTGPQRKTSRAPCQRTRSAAMATAMGFRPRTRNVRRVAGASRPCAAKRRRRARRRSHGWAARASPRGADRSVLTQSATEVAPTHTCASPIAGRLLRSAQARPVLRRFLAISSLAAVSASTAAMAHARTAPRSSRRSAARALGASAIKRAMLLPVNPARSLPRCRAPPADTSEPVALTSSPARPRRRTV